MISIEAEIITIGDEILYGQILNTNTQWLSETLTQNGFSVIKHTSVGDNRKAILDAISNAFNRAKIVLITGGLGPTKDDITKHTLAEYFNCKLEIHERSLAEVTALMQSRGRELNELNRLQALQPTAAEPITNHIGTAPGMWFNKDKSVLISMPGVPQEMKKMFSETVLPRLIQQFDPPIIEHYYLRTVGIPESNLAQIIEKWEDALPAHIRLAYLPNFGQVKLRLTAKGNNRETLKAEMKSLVQEVETLIGDYIYSQNDEELEQVIGFLLKSKNATLSIAESFTGGSLASTLVSVSGASDYFLGGITAYTESQKINWLKVPKATIEKHTVYSEETALAMARAVREATGSTYALATTGVAGPMDTTNGIPAGKVFLALIGPEFEEAKTLQLLKDRSLNIRLGCLYSLNLLRKRLISIQ